MLRNLFFLLVVQLMGSRKKLWLQLNQKFVLECISILSFSCSFKDLLQIFRPNHASPDAGLIATDSHAPTVLLQVGDGIKRAG